MAWTGLICNATLTNSATALTGGIAGSPCLTICWRVVYGHLIRLWLSLVYNHFELLSLTQRKGSYRSMGKVCAVFFVRLRRHLWQRDITG